MTLICGEIYFAEKVVNSSYWNLPKYPIRRHTIF